jgi:predicted ATPase/DNA-binding CsgD family transcriptional regulator
LKSTFATGFLLIEMDLTNFPVQLTSFIGREREIADIKRLLFSSHLVTLTGAGGSGKTRLAVQIANAVSEDFEDGVWFVDLALLSEPDLVPQLVMEALGLHFSASQPVLESLLDFLQPKRMLLILDNCEHLRAACAQLVGLVLHGAPELRILATSRESLAVAGERIYPISGLACPEFEHEAVQKAELHDFMTYDAIRMFNDRAQAVSPVFTTTSENAFAVAEICRRLDGLPLAIELASARVNVLTVQEIAARLEDRFSLLTSGQRASRTARHQTLRAAIDWSYALLTSDERFFLRLLAVFNPGCSLDLVEAIWPGLGIGEGLPLDLLSSLVNKSFVVAETSRRDQARYRLLETIREYALEKLEEAGEAARLRDSHLDLFLARAEEAAPKLNEAYQKLWLNWLEGEHDNLRAALAWAVESGRTEAGMRIAIALVHFWDIRAYVQEGLAWFQHLLVQADNRIALDIRVNALVNASFMAMAHGDSQASLAYGHEAVELAERACDEGSPLLAFALGGLISSAQATGDYQTAYAIVERAMNFLRGSVPSYYLRSGLYFQGENAIQLGYYDTARELLAESMALARQDGDSAQMANIYNTLGDLARLEQNYTGATAAYENSMALLRELNSPNDASVLGNLGFTSLHFGNGEQAHQLFSESMAIYQAHQNEAGMLECLIGLAATAVVNGLPAAGMRLLAAAEAISGQPSASKWKATRMEYEYFTVLAHANLSEAEFQAEQAAGRMMSLDQATAYAINLPSKPRIPLSVEESLDILTGREREVAALIGQGKTNGEIAAELFLSKRTVETHSSHILTKLGLTNRAQIIRWALDHGLTQTSS